MICPNDTTNVREFSYSEDCNEISYFDVVFTVLCYIIMVINTITIGFVIKKVFKHNKILFVIVLLAYITNCGICIRFSIIGFGNIRPIQSIPFTLYIYVLATCAITVVFLIIYNQLTVIGRGQIGGKNTFFYKYRIYVVLILLIISYIGFTVAPFISFFLYVPLYYTFWGSVMLGTLMMLPAFVICASVILRLTLSMDNPKTRKSGIRTFIIMLVAILLCCSTCGIGAYMMYDNTQENLFVNLAWIIDLFLNLLIMYMFSGKHIYDMCGLDETLDPIDPVEMNRFDYGIKDKTKIPSDIMTTTIKEEKESDSVRSTDSTPDNQSVTNTIDIVVENK